MSAAFLRLRSSDEYALFGNSAFTQPGYSTFNPTATKVQSVALVGTSGGGKTTLSQLAAGILQADSGSVQLGRLNVPDLDYRWLREQVALVPQVRICQDEMSAFV